MSLPQLKRTSKSGKARENKDHLRRRMDLWKNSKINSLVEEGKAIQKRLPTGKTKKDDNEDVFRLCARQSK